MMYNGNVNLGIKIGDKVINTNWLDQVCEIKHINENLDLVMLENENGDTIYSYTTYLKKIEPVRANITGPGMYNKDITIMELKSQLAKAEYVLGVITCCNKIEDACFEAENYFKEKL